MIERGITQTQLGDGAIGVEDRCVVSATEGIADGRVRHRRQFLGEPHCHLARASDSAGTFLGVHLGYLYLVVVSDGLLNRFERYLAVIRTEQIL